MYSPTLDQLIEEEFIKISYVSLHRFSTMSEEALAHFGKLTVTGVWVPGNLLKTVLSIVDFPSAKKAIARDLIKNSLRKGIHSSLLLDLVILQRERVNTFRGRLGFSVLATFFKTKLFWMCRKNDLLIIPSDMWDFVPLKRRKKVILEVRWLTQDLIDSLAIPKMIYHSHESISTSGIPVMPAEVFREFLGFLTYSGIAKDSIILSGAEPEKILVVPLLRRDTLAISNETVDSRSQRLLYVGRSAPDKRLDLAVEIASRLRLPLDVVGKYDASAVEWLDEQPGVCYMGALTNNALLSLMRTNLALLAPGVESWGLAVVEALQSGMSVFASRFTGVTEWIDHPNLHIISEMNSDLFVEEFKIYKTTSETCKIFKDINFESKWRKFLSNRGIYNSQFNPYC
jgi:glycosyltransferase involved in cell wall biosynthesis